MNTRLQVEHPITEMRTGIDLVHQQLRIAMGEKLPFAQHDITFRGHAIECRIYAEDSLNGFLPSTGRVTHLKPAQGFGIREDRGIEQGGEISVYYDPMISKLVAHGQTREEAIAKLKRALKEYEILGVKVNIPFNLFVLNHPAFVQGDFDTHFIAKYFEPGALPFPTEQEERVAALVAAMLEEGTIALRLKGELAGSANHHPASSKWQQKRFDALR
jgi:acetyl-CoA carboxylase biotin carboxylase subunit